MQFHTIYFNHIFNCPSSPQILVLTALLAFFVALKKLESKIGRARFAPDFGPPSGTRTVPGILQLFSYIVEINKNNCVDFQVFCDSAKPILSK